MHAATYKAILDCFLLLGMKAVYTGKGLSPKDIVVLYKMPDEEYSLGDTTVVAETATFEIKTEDVDRPLPGDVIEIEERRYQIIGEPLRGPGRLVWEVTAVVM